MTGIAGSGIVGGGLEGGVVGGLRGGLVRGGERTTVRIDLTPRASRQVRSLLAARPGESYGLRLCCEDGALVDGTGSTGIGYLLSLAPQPHEGDLVLPRNGFEVFVPSGQTARLDGVRIDFVESESAAGFVVDPPARPPRQRRPWDDGRAGAAPVPASPELVAQVEAALAQVRPALQADGGDLALVAVEGDVAYVELVGACSGCSSALVTLTELVERVVVAAVPAITRVVST